MEKTYGINAATAKPTAPTNYAGAATHLVGTDRCQIALKG